MNKEKKVCVCVCVCAYYKVCSKEDSNAMIFEQKPEISGQTSRL